MRSSTGATTGSPACAAAAADPAALASAAHELRGASGTIGADRVAALSRELEVAARRGDPGVRPGLLDELEVALADAAEEIAAFVSARS